MAVSINWGVLFVGVLMIRALLFGSILGPLIFGNSHVVSSKEELALERWEGCHQPAFATQSVCM